MQTNQKMVGKNVNLSSLVAQTSVKDLGLVDLKRTLVWTLQTLLFHQMLTPMTLLLIYFLNFRALNYLDLCKLLFKLIWIPILGQDAEWAQECAYLKKRNWFTFEKELVLKSHVRVPLVLSPQSRGYKHQLKASENYQVPLQALYHRIFFLRFFSLMYIG
jgi:hypothetical protein